MEGTPADVVKHDGLGQAAGDQDAFHQLHRDEVSLVGLGAGDHDAAVSFGPAVGVEQALGEIAGRKEIEEPELVLPAQTVGLELCQQVERSEVAAELLAGCLGREVSSIRLVPVEDDAAVLDEVECVIDALVGDRLAAIEEPGLVDLVLGEADGIEQSWSEVSVDHAHRGVAEHERDHATAADFGGHFACDGDCLRADRAQQLGARRRHMRCGRKCTSRRVAP